MGNRGDAERFRAIEKSYRAAFDKPLAMQTAKTGGYIPPALDQTVGGNDWDNLLLLYPEPLFEPFDSRVTASIRKSRQGYREGILGYVLPPDGPASGKTIELLRNMLVREYGKDLYLYSALSPAWLEPGQTIVVDRAPTAFGPISTTLRAGAPALSFDHAVQDYQREYRARYAEFLRTGKIRP